MANTSSLRKAVRSHLDAGFYAVAGITGLGLAYLFPLIIRASTKGVGETMLTAGLILAGTLLFALLVWLAIYLPATVIADRISGSSASRYWLSALLCTIGLGAVALFVAIRYVEPRYILARLLLLLAAIPLGLGGGIYSFLRKWILEHKGREQSLAS